MHFTRNRRTFLIGFAANLVGLGLLAAPFRIAGTTQSSQEAAVGARLMRGAVDLHYHVDPGSSARGSSSTTETLRGQPYGLDPRRRTEPCFLSEFWTKNEQPKE